MKNKVAILAGMLLVLAVSINTAKAQNTANNLENKLVIVLHVQDHFTKEILPEDSTTVVINNINSIIEAAKPENVLYVNHVHHILNLSFRKIYVDKFKDLDTRLNIVNKNIFTEKGYDIFESDEIKEFIRAKNINEIIVIGFMAEQHVSKTSLGGIKNNYKVYIVPQAIKGFSAKGKAKALKKLIQKGVGELSM